MIELNPEVHDRLLTPALVVSPEIVMKNIRSMIDVVNGDLDRLRPHIKTHKSAEILQILLDEGVEKVKCSTLAEVEIAQMVGIPDILFCKQPALSELDWLLSSKESHPMSELSILVDDKNHFSKLESMFLERSSQLGVFIDINCGMSRTGVSMGDSAVELVQNLQSSQSVSHVGLHLYDGHIHDADPVLRLQQFHEWHSVGEKWIKNQISDPISEIIAGGSPTFEIVAKNTSWVCSPGTPILWDHGYATNMPELPFQPAAHVVCRIISRPEPNLICLDLGHKSIASENPLKKRVFFPAFPEAEFVQHNEEHMVLRIDKVNDLKIGDVLIGIPWHICPTVALYDYFHCVEQDGGIRGMWPVSARRRVY